MSRDVDAQVVALRDPATNPNPEELKRAFSAPPSPRSHPFEDDHTACRAGVAPLIDRRAHHGLAGDVVRTFAPNTEASPVAILVQFLAAFGSVVGRGPYVSVGETRHHANEFVLVVGQSARARKGDSKNAALRAVREADPTWNVQAGLSTGEGLIHAVRDAVIRASRGRDPEIVDSGVSDKRLFVVESEFASVLRVMSRDGNNLSPLLRTAWDGDPVLGNLTKNSTERATHAHVAVVAHATPADLTRYLSDTETANGFANRFLFVLVERAQLLPNPTPTDAAAVAQLAENVRAAIEAATTVGEVRRTPRAAALWNELYPILSADRPGLVGDLLARAEAHVLRLSLIYALLDSSKEIDVQHIEAALAVWAACEASVRLLFGDGTGNPDADRIAEEIEPGEEMTRNEIREALFSNRISSRRLTDALNVLAETPEWELVRYPTGGRTAEAIRRLPLDDDGTAWSSAATDGKEAA